MVKPLFEQGSRHSYQDIFLRGEDRSRTLHTSLLDLDCGQATLFIWTAWVTLMYEGRMRVLNPAALEEDES